ncbi:MAG: tRNA-specific adenosine deaminase [Acidiferrobacteraceae bacterium]|nr:tRNA-specific adenosine deaminase [Acidiferrobacteraceae bacterium]|tara:strand:+ start:141 stop:590 length:450 start_codon:yes stop_codon:yes gene_type:complete
MVDHEQYMRIALEEAERGAAEGNVAVGSVLVDGHNVVARGRNLVISTSDPTAHAETVALRHAGEQLGHTDFSDLTLYTTFEPCPMCCGAILASGVRVLVMGARYDLKESRWGRYTVESLLDLTNSAGQLIVITGVLTQACTDVRQLEAE